MNHNWYAVITAKVLLSKDLSSTQKLLIALIANLSNERGYCFASNKYLGDCLSISEDRISKSLSDLVEKKWIGRVVKLKPDNSVDFRTLVVIDEADPLPVKTTIPPGENTDTPPGKNNYIITNSSNNKERISEHAKSNLFREPKVPTKNEVLEAVLNCGGTKEMAKSFWEQYEGTGWFKGNSPIVNFIPLAQKWVDTWKRINKDKEDAPGAAPLTRNI